MELDNRTLLVVVTFSTAIQTLAMFYVWRMQLRERSVGLMTIGFVFIVVGSALIVSRPFMPPALSIVGGNTAIIALVSTPRGLLRRTYWPVAGVMLFHCTFAFGRGVATAIGGPLGDLFASNIVTAIWLLESFAAINLVGLGLILMISQRLQLELDRQASYDGLTGSLNRRAFERIAESEWSRAVRHDLPLSVLVLDLDRFKALNDTHGHDAGDLWLKSFADLCRGLLRREDLLCRYGGEEFLALLPQTSGEAAMQVAERIRRSVEGMRIAHNGTDIAVTVSIGVATWNETVTDLKTMIAAADRALYRAKAAGRNRVESSEAG